MPGHIRRRNNRWQARYRTPNGDERSRTFNRKVDAQRWLTDQTHHLDRGTWTDPAAGRITFADWVDHYRDSTPVRESTKAKNLAAARRWFIPAFGDTNLSALTPTDVQAAIGSMTEAGLAPSTIRSYLGGLQAILSAAVTEGALAKSPAGAVRLPRVERTEVRPLEVSDLWELADQIGDRYRAMVVLSGLVGLRFGECAALRWSRVDLGRPSVRVAESLSEVAGALSVGPPKTRAARRTLVVPAVVASELSAHRDRFGDGGGDGLVFTAPAGGLLRRPQFRSRVWLPAVDAAGVGWATFHTLRHTAASVLIAGGAHPRVLQARLGHASARMSLEVYGHLFDAADDAAADMIAGVVDSAV